MNLSICAGLLTLGALGAITLATGWQKDWPRFAFFMAVTVVVVAFGAVLSLPGILW